MLKRKQPNRFVVAPHDHISKFEAVAASIGQELKRGATTSVTALAAATAPVCVVAHVPVAITPGPVCVAAHVPVAIAPGTVPVELPVVVMPPPSLMITKTPKFPIMTEASRVPIVRIVSPAWSSSIHTTFAGVVTIHKLSAFLVPIRPALGPSLGRSAH